MPIRKLIARLGIGAGEDSLVKCAVCKASYEEKPLNCHACGHGDFVRE